MQRAIATRMIKPDRRIKSLLGGDDSTVFVEKLSPAVHLRRLYARRIMRNLGLVLTLTLAPLLMQASFSYHVAHTYVVGGDGSWDYIVPDPPNHRLFIGRQNRVMVVDENDGKVLGEVIGIKGAHGTALAPATGHGFATSGNDESVVMFDLKTFKELGRIHAAEDADAILFDPASNRVFTLNGDAHSSTVIDPVKGTLITNIPLGGKPEYGVSAGDGKVYANLTDTSEVVEIDAKTATVARRWSTAPCKQPVAMAIDTVHQRLFSGCRSGVMAVSDYQAGKVVATRPDRNRRRRRRIRPVFRRRVCVQRGRDADRDSPGLARHLSRRGHRADRRRLAQHGPGPGQPPRVPRRREVRPGAGRRPRTRTGRTRILLAAGDRALKRGGSYPPRRPLRSFSAAVTFGIIKSECLMPGVAAGAPRCFLPGASTLPPLRPVCALRVAMDSP